MPWRPRVRPCVRTRFGKARTARLVRAHLAEGNQSQALCELERYGRLLRAELGLHPSARLLELMPHRRHLPPL
jgi:DNA-binding SARP family transcriptional activator